jgi:probable phosphoglycerate mutase
MLLLLIRHGDTDVTGKVLVGRTPGVHLNQAGARQAEALADRLKDVPIAAIYSSPLERSLETAAPLARARDMTVHVEAGLSEVDYGDWTGQPLKQLQRTDLWKQVHTHPSDVRFPNGEALREAQARVIDALESVFKSHSKECVAAFSHGDAIKAAIAHLLGMHMDLFQRIHVGTASVSAVLVGDAYPRLVLLNDTGGLGWLRPRRKRRSVRAKEN